MSPRRSVVQSLLVSVIAAAALAVTVGPAGAASPTEKAEAKKATVAVLYFDYTGQSEEMAMLRKGLAQMLISDLGVVDGVRLVERDRLQDIIEELELSKSRKIDPKTAQRVGKLLGAKYMVLGGYFDLMGTLRVDARLVETETGKIVSSVGANGKVDDFLTIEQTVAAGLAQVLGSGELEGFTGRVIRRTPPDKRPADKRPADKPADKQPADKQVDPPVEEVPAEAPPKPPSKLEAKTAVRYGKALDAIDKGDKETAKAELEAVVAEQPDFTLAQADLQALIR